MPCRDYEGDDGKVAQSSYDALVKLERGAQQRADKFVKMLCEALTILDLAPIIPGVLSKETRDWWAHHKQCDANAKAAEERRKNEAAAKLEEQARRVRLVNSAMAKLTAEERKALNI
jgi:hypothetical protein